MATLKLIPNYLNSRETAYNILSNNKWFNDEDWLNMSRKGELDQYITMLSNTDKINESKFYSDYNYEYADSNSRLASLYNELFADRTNVDVERKRPITDANGNVVLNNKGQIEYETYKASDYDYYKEVIKNNNDRNYQQYLIEQEESRKANMKAGEKLLYDTLSVGSTLVSSAASIIDGLLNTISSIGNGIDAMFRNENFVSAVEKTMASDNFRLFEQLGLQDALYEFERKFTSMRNVDGSYTNGFGKYVGGIVNTLGQMLPAMVAGKVAGVGASKFGASANTVSNVSKAASSLVFYAPVTSQSVREMYEQMGNDIMSVPTGSILANATIKSALQYGVEIGLGKILGGSALDQMVFGRATSTKIGSSLTKNALSRLGHDFVSEGLEEVFQDTSDFLVDKAFGVIINENFGEITNLTYQSLMDSFVIGGLASFAGSAMRILTTRSVDSSKPKLDKDGNVVYDKDRDIKFKKLNKLASWEYGLNIQSFVENFNTLQNQVGDFVKLYDSNSKEGRKYADAFMEMYSAYRMITSVYQELGEERFKAANDILTKVTSLINEGKFSNTHLSSYSEELFSDLSSIKSELIEKIESAKMTKKVASIGREDDIKSLTVSDNIKNELESMLSSDPSINNIVLTKDGNNVVTYNGNVFIPINYLKSTGANTIFQTIAEQNLVENIVKGNYTGAPLKKVLNVFREVSSNADATIEEAVYNLVFNNSFFKIMLYNGNVDMYKFISSLYDIEQKINGNNVRDKIYKKKISTVVDDMRKSVYDYLLVQDSADENISILTDEQKIRIRSERYCRNLYMRVLDNTSFKKLSDRDWEILRRRVNSMPVIQDIKDRIYKNLQSQSVNVRTGAMNYIANTYRGIFRSGYDGKTYMPNNSIPNSMFNIFLQNNGLTIETISDLNVNNFVRDGVSIYGEYNKENITKYWQNEFNRYSNNRYGFKYDKFNNIVIYETSTNKQVGFSTYALKIPDITRENNIETKTITQRGDKKNYLVEELLNDNVDIATSAYLSIDDVIKNPALLSDTIRQDISNFGDLTPDNVFLYLRRYFINKLGSVTVLALNDGSYAFGNIKPMTSLLRVKDIKIDKTTSVRSLIKKEHLYGRLEYINVRLTDRNIVAEYNISDNTIYINRKLSENGGDLLKFAFLHEFQHAIQVENSMNLGIDSNWINIKTISKTMRQNIINDVRKHRPEFFKDVEKGSDTELKIVNDFVYYASGESTAYGVDASDVIDFYPVIVTTNNGKGTVIKFPWGSSYSISSVLPAHLVKELGKFDIKLSSEYKKMCESFISTFYNEINGKADTKIALNYFRETNERDGLDRILSIYSLIDDEGFIINIYEYLMKNMREIKYSSFIRNVYQLSCDRLSELELFFKGVLDVDKVADVKILDSNQLFDLWKKYNPRQSLSEIGNKVFDKLNLLNQRNPSNIKIANWVRYADKNSNSAAGFNFFDLIRYDTTFFNNDNRLSVSSTLLHEAIHAVTNPLTTLHTIGILKLLNFRLDNVVYLINKCYEKAKEIALESHNLKFSYRYSSLDEFLAGISDTKFQEHLKQLVESINNTPYIQTMCENVMMITRKSCTSYVDCLNSLFEYMVDNVSVHLYERYLSLDSPNKRKTYAWATYPDTHDGKYVELEYDKTLNKIYRVENNNRIYEGDINFEIKSDIGKLDYDREFVNSLKKDTEKTKLKNNLNKKQSENYLKIMSALTKEAKSLIRSNANITPKEMLDTLSKKYENVSKDLIKRAVLLARGKGRVSLDIAEKKYKNAFEEGETKKPQYRSYQEGETETAIIKNEDGRGKWIEKRPIVDEDGNVVRDENGLIKYKYVYKSKRYVSQRESKSTNLEKYGYTSKYKRTQLSSELKKFILNANDKIDSELWNKVKSGKIKTQDVMDYFRDSDSIDDTTFKLINDSFFHNTKISNLSQLENFILKSPDYYAARAMLRNMGYGELLSSNTDPDLLEKFVKIISVDKNLKKTYDNIVSRYYGSLKTGKSYDISNKNLRRLWMVYFDGSFSTAGYISSIAKIAAINKWLITGEGDTKSTKRIEEQTGEDLTLEGMISDANALSAFDEIFNSQERDEQIRVIYMLLGRKAIKSFMEKGMSFRQAETKFNLEIDKLRDLDDESFEKKYRKIVGNLSKKQILKIYYKQIMAEAGGINIQKLSDSQTDKFENVAEKVVNKIERPSSAIVNNIRSISRTIRLNLSDKSKNLFLKENSDVFDSNIKVKNEVLKDSNGKYFDTNKLEAIEDRIRKLSTDVRSNAYTSKRALDFKRRMEKELDALRAKNEKLLENAITGKNSNSQRIVYQVSDDKIVIDTNREIPAVLAKLFDNTRFKNAAKTTTKILSAEDERHVKTSFNEFVDRNAEILGSMSQAEAEDMLDFFLTSEIMPSTTNARTYASLQANLITFIIACNNSGRFVFPSEKITQLEERMKIILATSAVTLSTWKSALNILKPEETLVASFAKRADIEITDEEKGIIVSAMQSGDTAKIQNAFESVYSSIITRYKGKRSTIFENLLTFQRLAMLSSPGTWIRNYVSNVMVEKGNVLSEKISKPITDLIERVFPKKKWRRDNQYKIIGTVVSNEVKQFIKENIIDTNLLELMKDGFSKYNIRKESISKTNADSAIATILSNAIITKLEREYGLNNKALNKLSNFIFDRLSDDKYIGRSAIRYFGKVLTEDKTDLSQGLKNAEVIEKLADSYILAMSDYMHKTNFWNDVELKLKERFGDGALFIYKQFLPFAAASWNWFLEGLNYTPIGLAKSIINFAKLEKTIDKLKSESDSGQRTVSSRFAEYIARRNIGKGVIGTIGFLVGSIFALLGIAGIDEEDEVYKLRVGDVYIDISNIFGSQGILAGIAMFSTIKKESDVMGAIAATLNSMFLDSTFTELFNILRPGQNLGTLILEQPFDSLQMFIPNIIKTFTSICNVYKIKYIDGILGKLEYIVSSSIPFIAYALPKKIDPYTGENQVMYKAQFITNLVNKLSPLKISPYNISENEKIALSLGVRKSELTGMYDMNGDGTVEKVLSSSEISAVNEFYGKLNKKYLDEFISGKTSYRVLNEKTNTYETLKYNKMTDKQKATVIERIMSNNSSIAKIYILTSTGKYKYYADDSTYSTLKQLGVIKNVYKENGKFSGFVKN